MARTDSWNASFAVPRRGGRPSSEVAGRTAVLYRPTRLAWQRTAVPAYETTMMNGKASLSDLFINQSRSNGLDWWFHFSSSASEPAPTCRSVSWSGPEAHRTTHPASQQPMANSYNTRCSTRLVGQNNFLPLPAALGCTRSCHVPCCIWSTW